MSIRRPTVSVLSMLHACPQQQACNERMGHEVGVLCLQTAMCVRRRDLNGTRVAWNEVHLILYGRFQTGDNQTGCGSIEELLQVYFLMSRLLFILHCTMQCVRG